MAPQPQQSRLLNLPAELRLEIYEHAVRDPPQETLSCRLGASEIEVERYTDWEYPPIRLADSYHALVQTCKQLHDEVLKWTRSRQVLELMVDCYLKDHSMRSWQPDSFKIPEYCCLSKVCLHIDLTAHENFEEPCNLQKVFGDLVVLTRKVRLARCVQLTITFPRSVDDENVYALLQGFPTMCVFAVHPRSIRVEHEFDMFNDYRENE